MTANLLTLNSCKTEFLLIGLKQQLVKIKKLPSLNSTNSTLNLGFIFDEHLTFSVTHYYNLPNSQFHIKVLQQTKNSLVSAVINVLSIPVLLSNLYTLAKLINENNNELNEASVSYIQNSHGCSTCLSV